MKRFNNLYHQIWSADNILAAIENACKGKSHYDEVERIQKNIDYYAGKLQVMLALEKYRPSAYQEFDRVENGKLRHIHKLPFYPDRIIHHAICQVCEPIWMKQYIRDTYGSIKGRGIHDGVKRVQNALKNYPQQTTFCLKLDIKKYYPSVDHATMRGIIRRKIKCANTLNLLDLIIQSAPGLPIGNYTSQHLANLYLSGLDHYAKEDLNIKHYFRYCDDIVILGSCKAHLHNLRRNIEAYLHQELKLSLKSSWQVFPVAVRGIDFLGYRFFPTYTLLRKSIAKRFIKRMKQLKGHEDLKRSKTAQSSIASYKGWLKYASCHNLGKKHLPA